MGFAEKKGITVASGFKLQAQSPIDARQVVDSIAERDELVTINAAYAGLSVYVKEKQKEYLYDGTTWKEKTTGEAYTHPTGSGYNHIPSGGASGQILGWESDGTAKWQDNDSIPSSQKGTAGGVAELDGSGKVPAAQLPSYVDDVIEGYLSDGIMYEEEGHITQITGESGKIYVDLATGKTYRWSGSAYAVISETIALGETSSTAYRGDRGKAAYEHSQQPHAPANAEANVQSDWNESNEESDAFIKNKPASLPANGGNADTVGGHTVEANVPANAVFTDTTYSPATTEDDGLMSAEDKAKVDGMDDKFAAKATNLAGYGIQDAYTKAQTDSAISTAVGTAITGIYKVKGSIAFAALPTDDVQEGWVYNITDDFTTTEAFVEGAGHEYKAGTNVVYTEAGWDCMAGVYDFSDFVRVDDIVTLTEEEINEICVMPEV